MPFCSKFFNQEKKLNELDDVIQDKILRISQMKAEIKNLENKINHITNEIENLENEKVELSDIISENDYRIKDFSKQKQKFLEALDMTENQISEYDIKKVKQEIFVLKENINEAISKKIGLRKKLNSLKEELEGYQNQRIPISIDCVNLQTEIEKKGITSEFLFETIDFKKNQEKWRVILESILNKEKIGLVVSEKHQLLAEKLNRENQFNATVLSPRHEFAQHRKPEDSLCNWNHIFEVCPQKLSENSIIDLMNLKLGGIYFPETPDDLERYRTTKPFAQFASLDGYYYTIYSQSKIFKSNRTMIGKGANEIEILRIQEEILEVEELLNHNITNLEFLEEKCQKSENILELLKLIKESIEIGELIQENQILKNKLEEINEILRDPKKSIDDCENKIGNDDDLQKRLENELEIDNNEFQGLQEILESISNEFNGYLIKYNELFQDQRDRFDIEEFFIQYKEENIEYRGLLKKIKEFLKKIEEPTEKSENLNIQLERIKGALAQYNEYSEKDQINFETAIDDDERFKKEIVEFSNEIRKCEEQFNRADTQLIEELSKWERQVSKVFRQIMNELELDGELIFQRGKSSIDLELNIRVSNTIGGVFENIEESNFSGGETQRTAVAFMIAIISQSSYPYVVWDEFDSHVGDDHREMIAEVIKKYFANRKLIALSPQDIVQGYVRVFPRIYEVWKNDDGFSRLSLYISENNEKEKKEK